MTEKRFDEDSFRAAFGNLIKENPADAVAVAAGWRNRFIRMKDNAKKEAETLISNIVERLGLTTEQAEELRSMIVEAQTHTDEIQG